MGTRYSSNTIVGWNANPPSNDGSQTANNQLSWTKHLDKIGTPLKTLAESINSDIVTALDTSCRPISSSDNTVAGDHLRTVEITFAITAAITVSLADAATMGNGYIVTISNQSDITCNISTVGAEDTVDGTLIVGSPYRFIWPHCTLTFIVNDEEIGYIVQSSNNFDGHWIARDFDAANYTASGSMTWTVAGGDVLTDAYCMNGKTMKVNAIVNTSTVGGSASTALRIAIPESKVAKRDMQTICRVAQHSMAPAVAFCRVTAASTYIEVFADIIGSNNWALGADQTYVNLQFEFEIQ